MALYTCKTINDINEFADSHGIQFKDEDMIQSSGHFSPLDGGGRLYYVTNLKNLHMTYSNGINLKEEYKPNSQIPTDENFLNNFSDVAQEIISTAIHPLAIKLSKNVCYEESEELYALPILENNEISAFDIGLQPGTYDNTKQWLTFNSDSYSPFQLVDDVDDDKIINNIYASDEDIKPTATVCQILSNLKLNDYASFDDSIPAQNSLKLQTFLDNLPKWNYEKDTAKKTSRLPISTTDLDKGVYHQPEENNYTFRPKIYRSDSAIPLVIVFPQGYWTFRDPIVLSNAVTIKGIADKNVAYFYQSNSYNYNQAKATSNYTADSKMVFAPCEMQLEHEIQETEIELRNLTPQTSVTSSTDVNNTFILTDLDMETHSINEWPLNNKKIIHVYLEAGTIFYTNNKSCLIEKQNRKLDDSGIDFDTYSSWEILDERYNGITSDLYSTTIEESNNYIFFISDTADTKYTFKDPYQLYKSDIENGTYSDNDIFTNSVVWDDEGENKLQPKEKIYSRIKKYEKIGQINKLVDNKKTLEKLSPKDAAIGNSFAYVEVLEDSKVYKCFKTHMWKEQPTFTETPSENIINITCNTFNNINEFLQRFIYRGLIDKCLSNSNVLNIINSVPLITKIMIDVQALKSQDSITAEAITGQVAITENKTIYDLLSLTDLYNLFIALQSKFDRESYNKAQDDSEKQIQAIADLNILENPIKIKTEKLLQYCKIRKANIVWSEIWPNLPQSTQINIFNNVFKAIFKSDKTNIKNWLLLKYYLENDITKEQNIINLTNSFDTNIQITMYEALKFFSSSYFDNSDFNNIDKYLLECSKISKFLNTKINNIYDYTFKIINSNNINDIHYYKAESTINYNYLGQIKAYLHNSLVSEQLSAEDKQILENCYKDLWYGDIIENDSNESKPVLFKVSYEKQYLPILPEIHAYGKNNFSSPDLLITSVNDNRNVLETERELAHRIEELNDLEADKHVLNIETGEIFHKIPKRTNKIKYTGIKYTDIDGRLFNFIDFPLWYNPSIRTDNITGNNKPETQPETSYIQNNVLKYIIKMQEEEGVCLVDHTVLCYTFWDNKYYSVTIPARDFPNSYIQTTFTSNNVEHGNLNNLSDIQNYYITNKINTPSYYIYDVNETVYEIDESYTVQRSSNIPFIKISEPEDRQILLNDIYKTPTNWAYNHMTMILYKKIAGKWREYGRLNKNLIYQVSEKEFEDIRDNDFTALDNQLKSLRAGTLFIVCKDSSNFTITDFILCQRADIQFEDDSGTIKGQWVVDQNKTAEYFINSTRLKNKRLNQIYQVQNTNGTAIPNWYIRKTYAQSRGLINNSYINPFKPVEHNHYYQMNNHNIINTAFLFNNSSMTSISDILIQAENGYTIKNNPLNDLCPNTNYRGKDHNGDKYLQRENIIYTRGISGLTAAAPKRVQFTGQIPIEINYLSQNQYNAKGTIRLNATQDGSRSTSQAMRIEKGGFSGFSDNAVTLGNIARVNDVNFIYCWAGINGGTDNFYRYLYIQSCFFGILTNGHTNFAYDCYIDMMNGFSVATAGSYTTLIKPDYDGNLHFEIDYITADSGVSLHGFYNIGSDSNLYGTFLANESTGTQCTIAGHSTNSGRIWNQRLTAIGRVFTNQGTLRFEDPDDITQDLTSAKKQIAIIDYFPFYELIDTSPTVTKKLLKIYNDRDDHVFKAEDFNIIITNMYDHHFNQQNEVTRATITATTQQKWNWEKLIGTAPININSAHNFLNYSSILGRNQPYSGIYIGYMRSPIFGINASSIYGGASYGIFSSSYFNSFKPVNIDYMNNMINYPTHINSPESIIFEVPINNALNQSLFITMTVDAFGNITYAITGSLSIYKDKYIDLPITQLFNNSPNFIRTLKPRTQVQPQESLRSDQIIVPLYSNYKFKSNIVKDIAPAGTLVGVAVMKLDLANNTLVATILPYITYCGPIISTQNNPSII